MLAKARNQNFNDRLALVNKMKSIGVLLPESEAAHTNNKSNDIQHITPPVNDRQEEHINTRHPEEVDQSSAGTNLSGGEGCAVDHKDVSLCFDDDTNVHDNDVWLQDEDKEQRVEVERMPDIPANVIRKVHVNIHQWLEA